MVLVFLVRQFQVIDWLKIANISNIGDSKGAETTVSNNTIFTSESVSEGHPDKMSDQISDAILDALLAQDPNARVACETMVKTGMVMLAGEVTSFAQIDYEQITRDIIVDIGYDSSDVGFDGASCAVMNALGKQSPDIPMGVD